MSTVPMVREEQAVAQSSPRDVAGQLMRVIEANPTAGAENLKALLDGMERITKWQAEQEFTAAFSRLKFPAIHKSAKGHNAKYAPYDEIQRIIDPILAAEGFTLTFSSGEATTQGIPTHGLLSHIGGHSRGGVIYLPPDVTPTRSGSTTMNALQQVGSSTSYGMRYVAKLMLNLRFVGDDDDAAASSAISQDQIDNIDAMLIDNELGAEYRSKLLETMNVKALSDLQRVQVPTILSLIRAKIKAKGAK